MLAPCPSRKLPSSRNYHIIQGILFLFVLSAIGIRVFGVFWGAPYMLHPDEGAIVRPTIRMLEQHTWIANSFNRPDQLEIKINAFFFSTVSHLFYNQPAYQLYKTNPFIFHVLARLLSTFSCIVLIGMSSIFIKSIMKLNLKEKLIVDIMLISFIGYGSLFMRHSLYATPDVPLALTFVVFSLLLYKYIINATYKNLLFASVSIACAVSVKYPGGMLAFFLLMAVFHTTVSKQKNLKKFFLSCVICGASFLLSIFSIAPNLLLSPQSVWSALLRESRSNHLSREVLGFWGNIQYYIGVMADNFGIVSFGIIILGLVLLERGKITLQKCKLYVLSIGPLYLLMISCSGLHWERWGTPVYIFYIFFFVISLVKIMRFFNGMPKKFVNVVYFFVIVAMINNITSGIAYFKYINRPEHITQTRKELNMLGVTKENSINDTYTPFTPLSGDNIFSFFNFHGDDKPILKQEFSHKKYVIMGSNFKRYAREQNKYPDIVHKYFLIRKYFGVIYDASGGARKSLYAAHDCNDFKKIYNNLIYICIGHDFFVRPCVVYALE